MKLHLDLGSSQEYLALKYHKENAFKENKLKIINITNNPEYAIFAKKYVNDINKLDFTKKYDFCFIGSIKSDIENRQWVIDFAKKYFTQNSIFINTDFEDDWIPLGIFDLTYKKIGFCPKNHSIDNKKQQQYRIVNENKFYFETMSKSNFVLCPAGDSPWSFRFYETLMCKSIPIVKSWHHTYRTKEEAKINYEFILSDDIGNIGNAKYNIDEMIKKNTSLFKKYHMLN